MIVDHIVDGDWPVYFDRARNVLVKLSWYEDVELRGWLLTRIFVPIDRRGQGVASRILAQLLAEADYEGATLLLEVPPNGKFEHATSELQDWYKEHDFERHSLTLWKRLPKRLR